MDADGFEPDKEEFDADSACADLFRWFQILPLSTSPENIDDLVDGEALLESLKTIDGDFFGNVRIESGIQNKVFFMRDLQDKMVEYINERQENSGASRLPESLVERITADVDRGGEAAYGRLLQLILVSSVLCSRKEEYIDVMRALDADVTVTISKGILDVIPLQRHDSETEAVNNRIDRPNSMTDATADWCDKCHSLHAEISHLSDERKKLLLANAKLKTDLEAAVDVDNERSPANQKIAALQKESAMLRESVSKLEASRDEYKTKYDDLHQHVGSLAIETDTMRRRTAEMERMKDELDEWRHKAATLGKYENEIKIYRKKMDEVGDLRQHLKTIEERNTELLKRNVELEQENSLVVSANSTADDQRKEIENLERELKLASTRIQKNQVELRDLQDQVNGLEKRNRLLESESRLVRSTSEDGGLVPLESSLSYELQMQSSFTKEDFLKLQFENSDLRKQMDCPRTSATENVRLPNGVVHKKDDVALNSSNDIDDRSTPPLDKSTQRVLPEDLASRSLSPEARFVAARNNDCDRMISQRDDQIKLLEHEIDFLRRHYTQQMRLMTAAWYRLGLRTEQQAANARLFGGPENQTYTPHSRPSTFLDEQRRAVVAPISTSPRAQNVPSSAYQLPSPRGSSRSFLR